MRDAVFLEDAPCDGRAQGGCEMACTLVWKEAWLQPIPGPQTRTEQQPDAIGRERAAQLHELVWRNVRPHNRQNATGAPVFACQATELPRATTRLSVWDLRQYGEDFTSGNARLNEIVSVLLLQLYSTVASAGIGFGSAMRWCYDTVQRFRGGSPYPCRPGKLSSQSRTPSLRLDLQPGDLVTVRSYPEILETVTEDLINRGMSFHPDMVSHCGRSFRVGKGPTRLIDEKTGLLIELKNRCVVLEGARCNGRFTKPLLCPRGMSPYWREIWLRKVHPDPIPPRQIESAQVNRRVP